MIPSGHRRLRSSSGGRHRPDERGDSGWQPVLDQLPGIEKVIVRDESACPAGDKYLTWTDLIAHAKYVDVIDSLYAG